MGCLLGHSHTEMRAGKFSMSEPEEHSDGRNNEIVITPGATMLKTTKEG